MHILHGVRRHRLQQPRRRWGAASLHSRPSALEREFKTDASDHSEMHAQVLSDRILHVFRCTCLSPTAWPPSRARSPTDRPVGASGKFSRFCSSCGIRGERQSARPGARASAALAGVVTLPRRQRKTRSGRRAVGTSRRLSTRRNSRPIRTIRSARHDRYWRALTVGLTREGTDAARGLSETGPRPLMRQAYRRLVVSHARASCPSSARRCAL